MLGLSVQFSRSVVSDSLRPYELQHTRLPCPSLSPRVSHSHPPSQWCIPSNHFIFCCSLSLLPSIFPSIRVFSNESALHIRWPNYWSFSFNINLSNEYSGLISFRIDWFDLLAVQGTCKSSPTPQFKSINSSVLSFLYGLTLTSIHDYWTRFCQHSLLSIKWYGSVTIWFQPELSQTDWQELRQATLVFPNHQLSWSSNIFLLTIYQIVRAMRLSKLLNLSI